MCGLAGFLKDDMLTPAEIAEDLPRMAQAIVHRGPDDGGVWSDAATGVGLCHRRLSIIDLSPLGHQPMHSASGRYVIVYNGEIYNFPELRRELVQCGHRFRGGSDTEVLLAAIEQWGLETTLQRALGMFAFALWDRQSRVLHLARDRFGEKPLYYGRCGRALLFGSELKALRQHSAWRGDIDRDALALMMQHDYVPAPFSIFQGIRKLHAGAWLTAQVRHGRIELNEQRYWWPEQMMAASSAETAPLSTTESLELIEAALSRSVARQMVADVPLGAFLSGGTDSSLVVALMQRAATGRVKTFSIGFAESAFDEAPFARAVADHLGTEHTELQVTAADCLDLVPELPRIHDEPFADPSQIPTYVVCRLARQSVTVALSGDGGDELFGGYGRYRVMMSKWRALRRLPASLRAGGSALLGSLPVSALDFAARPAAKWLGAKTTQGLGERLRDQSLRWRADTLQQFYAHALQRWPVTGQLVLGRSGDAGGSDALAPIRADGLKQMMYLDTCTYLPDDILVKVDRAAMAVSLETRVPLLDAEVAQAAWRIPSSVLMHDGRGKWVLRELLCKYVPAALVERPKRGFAVPIADWLRGELRPWANELLDAYRLHSDGFLDAAMVQRRWRQHLAGEANWSQHLWNVLMFQAWLAHWQSEKPRLDVRAVAG